MNKAQLLSDENLLCKQFRDIAAPDNVFESSVNNYLKTIAEIDADFALQINKDRLTVQESSDELDAYKSVLKNGGQTVSPTSLYHGFMEENY
jgi:hypothetical protein